jgi:hypothetical protein
MKLFSDHLVLMTRNPFSLLVSMQLKQAALAANDYEADILATEAWKNFATSGVKAWYVLYYYYLRIYVCISTSMYNVYYIYFQTKR